jgi:hypothetical protein
VQFDILEEIKGMGDDSPGVNDGFFRGIDKMFRSCGWIAHDEALRRHLQGKDSGKNAAQDGVKKGRLHGY